MATTPDPREAAWAAAWQHRPDLAAQYDVRSQIPGFAEALAEWADRAQATRTTLPGHFDLAYGSRPDETLDLFLPDPVRHPSPAPLLVFLHGGFWRKLHKDDFSWIAPAFVAQGIAVAIVNYSLAPAATLETIVDQCQRSLAWLHRAHPRYRTDPTRLIVSGHSAGGHLTCMMLATDWPRLAPDLPARLVSGGVALSPVVDLAPLAQVPFLQDDLNFTAERIRTLSPVRLVPTTNAPMIGAVGGRESEEFQRQHQLLADTWSSVWRGDIPLPDCDHLTVCEALADPGSALLRKVSQLCLAPDACAAPGGLG